MSKKTCKTRKQKIIRIYIAYVLQNDSTFAKYGSVCTFLHRFYGSVHFQIYNSKSISNLPNNNEIHSVNMKVRMVSTFLYLWYVVKTALVYGTPCIITEKLVSISVKWSVRKQLSTPLTRCSHQIPYRVAGLVHHNCTGYSKKYLRSS